MSLALNPIETMKVEAKRKNELNNKAHTIH